MVSTKVPLEQPADDNSGILPGAGTDGRVVVVVVVVVDGLVVVVVAVGVVVGGRVGVVGAMEV